MSENKIIIKGAKVNNLKNVDVEIPQNKLVVITGLSGSGKSSLAFDTLYAEGQRRYVESLSSYARQFMGRITKPDVESIQNIPPAIAIAQRVISRNPRSTVGTVTEIYEYVKLLYARIGRTFSPVSGAEVRRATVADVLHHIEGLAPDTKVYVMAPVVILAGRTLDEQLEIFAKEGYSRLVYDKELVDIEDFPKGKKKVKQNALFLLVDRFKASSMEDSQARIAGSVETAFTEGKGVCVVQTEAEDKCRQKSFSANMEMDGIKFEEPSLNLFSFNSPYGACPECGGTGIVDGIDPDLVIPDPSQSVFEDAVACWHGEKLSEWKQLFIRAAGRLDFPLHRAVEDLTPEEYDLLWNGDPDNEVYGIKQFFDFVDTQKYKIQYRVLYSRYRGRTTCPECRGLRLRKEATYVKVKGKSVTELVAMPISELYEFFKNFTFDSANEEKIAKHILVELVNRLTFLMEVGLGYLTL
ncbi:MAG: excinuclease ABC subunit A, partial [Bacteroidales bacterium]|nr:excinuclease ABC subunit A [Bacteroidales bacterium]